MTKITINNAIVKGSAIFLNNVTNSFGITEYNVSICKNIDDNISIFKEIFKDDDTIIMRPFRNKKTGIRFFAISVNGMVQSNEVYQSITAPLITLDFPTECDDLLDVISQEMVSNGDVKTRENISEIVCDVLYGDTTVFVDGCDKALTVETKGFELRSVSEPDSERGLKGSKEGFTESIIVNTSQIRRRILTSDLKFHFFRVGTRTNTLACVAYMDSLVDKRVLTELLRRISHIKTDGILDTNYIIEQIKDKRMSSFKTCGSTEKPDVAVANLLEGRIAIIVDGTPMVLTAPYLFIENFQSPDDYYLNFWYASVGRILRILCFFVSIALPSVYLGLVTYHSEMLPTEFMTTIAESTKDVPFPTFLECVFMLFVFEVLRETGVRMPDQVGQALSIVGGLVVGQAAVDAKIVSAPMVIVVAFTGIASLCVPRLTGAMLLIRLVALVCTALLGFYGLFMFMIGVLVHILGIRSFGYEYVHLSMRFQSFKDTFIRAPHQKMITRPRFAKDRIRK